MSTSSGSSHYTPTYPYLFIQGFLNAVKRRLQKGDVEMRAWVESPAFEEWLTAWPLDLDPGHVRKLLLNQWLVVTTRHKEDRD